MCGCSCSCGCGTMRQKQLVREFIREALYHRERGYFAAHDPIVPLKTPIQFNSLSGAAEFMSVYSKLGKTAPQHFLTPVELFQPWYSFAIANHLLTAHHKYLQRQKKQTDRLRIVEVGGGNGTNAKCVLDYLKVLREVYSSVQYTLVEISSGLAEKQQKLLDQSHPGKVTVVNQDFLEWEHRDEERSYVIGLEVLDNLPHDKLVYNPVDQEAQPKKLATFHQLFKQTEMEDWSQTSVETDPVTHALREVYEPLTDSLCIDTAKLYFEVDSTPQEGLRKPRQPSFSLNPFLRFLMEDPVDQRRKFESRQSDVLPYHFFLPTGAMQFLSKLHANFPNHVLLAADFTFLPVPEIGWKARWDPPQDRSTGDLRGCVNFPLVATEKADLLSYLQTPGEADIFFQTDFSKLAHMYAAVKRSAQYSRESTVQTSRDFMLRYGDATKTKTRTGYNPLLEQFSNTNFLLGTSEPLGTSKH